jgi:ATPase subunit of ABC transporter with duplicated ATPase domains
MISTANVSLSYGQRALFKNVNIKFLPGNCYGLIGANGAGKSTFLKILSGQIQPDQGSVIVPPGERIAVLKQNQFEFDDIEALKTVIMGNKQLYEIMEEKDRLYAKPDFSEADGMRSSELETAFADLNGWDAESSAAEMLESLGIPTVLHTRKMRDLEAGQKIRILLAQALFGNPDILLLDEPTNNLDLETINWLEEFLCDFKNTVIVVSHDRHFLDKVTTHTADIDFNEIAVYTGNYSFWYQASQLNLQQRYDRNKKTEDKSKELKAFIMRFSANASKSKQATSRKKMLDKLSVEEIKPSTRKYPHIVFQQTREAGKDILDITDLSASRSEYAAFSKLNMMVKKGDKIAFIGASALPASLLFEVLAGEKKASSGEYKWGVTTTVSYFPKDHDSYFSEDFSVLEWLTQYATTKEEREEEYIRGFLGKMFFSGQEVLKKTQVLSGGEKVRCLLARMMLQKPNVLILDDPTNHLDLESITALNKGLKDYPGTILFLSQDREIISSVATRIVELAPNGQIDREMEYEEFISRDDLTVARTQLYQ